MDLAPKLKQLEDRFKELEGLLGQGDATEDMARYTKMNKEYAELTPIMEAWHRYSGMLNEQADLKEILDDGDSDADMKEMATEELKGLAKEIPEIEAALQIMLLPKDEADDRNVIVEVRAGTGGDEAALFAGEVLRMYIRYAETNGWRTEMIDHTQTAIGGTKSATVQITGAGAFGRLKFESGVHRVQRVPDTETQGRVHTSAITVAVLPEAEEVDLNIEPKDIRVDVYRASGPGGQSVNTTDSAVRVTHEPTGIMAQCQDEKSQHKNRAQAMKVLLARLYEAERDRLAKERSDARSAQVGSGDRSERIRTYNFPQSRVTDHRINLTLHSLDAILAGDKLDEVIDPLLTEDQTRRLAALGEEAA